MPRSPDILCVYITIADKETAAALCRTLLAERLIACANIVEHGSSLYWWQGKITESPEAYILAKTQAPQIDAVIARVKALHPYDCPCIVSWPIGSAYPPFLQWVRQETSPAAS